jgi:hypothetical protein
MMRWFCPLALFFLLGLPACAPRSAKQVARMQSDVPWPVNAVIADLPAKTAMHHITLKRGNREFRFEATVETEPNYQAMVGMTPVGTVGFSMASEGAEVTFERIPFYKLPIRPERILTAYQWTFLDADILQPHLAALGLTLTEEDPQIREIRNKNERVAIIRYEAPDKYKGTAVFEQPQHKIKIHFLTRSVERFTP